MEKVRKAIRRFLYWLRIKCPDEACSGTLFCFKTHHLRTGGQLQVYKCRKCLREWV